MPSLRRIDLQPGNPQSCPQVPAGSSFKVCSEGDVLCVSPLPYNDSLCQSSPNPDDGGSGSSFPVAAVAVPVAVVGAAVVATWGYWLWRRRRRAARQAAAASVQQQPSVPKDWAGQVSVSCCALLVLSAECLLPPAQHVPYALHMLSPTLASFVQQSVCC